MAWGWPDYISIAERRKTAERQLIKLRKAGRPISPVRIEGRKIATSFWGKAWCDNLEGYQNYENRLPRGRSYVRNGLVIDLQITALQIKAQVSGSSVYKVAITMKPLAPSQWRSICADCAGGIDSLVELLQGRFSNGVMERLCRQEMGLFPKPSEISFSCSCLDGADMCKHVAAALYGVGARLDERPELLFTLRAVDEKELVAELDRDMPFSSKPVDTSRILETDDISALFGLEIEGPDVETSAIGAEPSEPVTPKPTRQKPSRKQAVKTTTVGATGSAATDTRSGATRVPKPVTSRKVTAKQVSKSSRAGEAIKQNNLDSRIAGTEPQSTAEPKGTVQNAKSEKKLKKPKRQFELTPDCYVKWWK